MRPFLKGYLAVRKILLALFLCLLSIGAVAGYRAYERHRDLEETIQWINATYNPHEGGENLGRGHGWQTHYLRKDQSEEVTEEFSTTITLKSACTIVIHSETLPVGVFREVPSVYTYTFNLGDLDPTTFELKTYDLQKDVFNCADPEEVKTYQLNCDSGELKFKTRNGAAAIEERGVITYANLTGKNHESRRSAKTNKAWLIVDDVPYARRLSKALTHAVVLCGGAPSKF